MCFFLDTSAQHWGNSVSGSITLSTQMLVYHDLGCKLMYISKTLVISQSIREAHLNEKVLERVGEQISRPITCLVLIIE